MAAYDLEEQEQLDELKTWWKLHGNLVTNILLAIALVAAAWQGWNWWQRQQSAQASAVFSALQTAAMQRDAKRVRELAGELVDKYSITDYAGRVPCWQRGCRLTPVIRAVPGCSWPGR